jgi:hypothetical protein
VGRSHAPPRPYRLGGGAIGDASVGGASVGGAGDLRNMTFGGPKRDRGSLCMPHVYNLPRSPVVRRNGRLCMTHTRWRSVAFRRPGVERRSLAVRTGSAVTFVTPEIGRAPLTAGAGAA